jgi:hypothetical protein
MTFVTRIAIIDPHFKSNLGPPPSFTLDLHYHIVPALQ